MNLRANRFRLLALAVALPICAEPGLAQGQTVQGLNFKVAEFFEPPYEKQMKFLLEGSKAVKQGTNGVLVTQPKCMTFQKDGAPEFLIKAPECFYDSTRRSISSSGPLSVLAADSKFTIEGTGFLWQQTNSSLFISNNVRTTVHPDLLQSSTTQATGMKSDEKGLKVSSDQFSYAEEAGLAIYRENVHVTGTNLSLTCELLTVRLPFHARELQTISASNHVTVVYGEIRASSQEAVYSPAEDTVRLNGDPKWNFGDRAGRGDEIVLERTNQVLRATGHASLQLPGHSINMSMLSPSSSGVTNHKAEAKDQLLEISAEHYVLRTNSALFGGGVIATQHQGEQLGGTLRCDTMTILLAGTNQLERLSANRNVEIEQGDQGFKAGQLVYTGSSGLLELTENPRWFAGTREGNGDDIIVVEGAMDVKGNAQMKLPASQFSPTGPNTNAVAMAANSTDKQFAEIRSHNYRLTKESARFEGQVSIDHPKMKWNCERLTVHFPAQGQVDRVVAEQDVIFDLINEQGQSVHGTGQQAVYTQSVSSSRTNELVELTGDPLLVTTNGIFKNRVIVFDRTENKVRATGNYKVTATTDKMPTNRFVIPKLKLTR